MATAVAAAASSRRHRPQNRGSIHGHEDYDMVARCVRGGLIPDLLWDAIRQRSINEKLRLILPLLHAAFIRNMRNIATLFVEAAHWELCGLSTADRHRDDWESAFF
jgi:hypothetical protein